MKLPKLDMDGLQAEVPIIQGGMAMGVSGAGLAAAVAGEGGVGVIAGVDIGYREPDFARDVLGANLRALKNQIREARRMAPRGILGVNLMVAMNHYEELARAAAEEGIDLIISGAGLPLKLPDLVKGLHTRIAPIVSSSKAAAAILQYWDKHYERTADLVVVEGPEAGGHLGFSREVLEGQKPPLRELVAEVLETVGPYREKFGKQIPVVAAGGIFTGADIAEHLKAGAGGVQMATRFVATDECDADLRFKQMYVRAEEEDIRIIQSPVGMPGRALLNPFLKRIADQGDEIKSCFRCLKGCNPKSAAYCISKALIHAVRGNVDDGLVFVGSSVYRIQKIVPVKELMDELVRGAQFALDC